MKLNEWLGTTTTTVVTLVVLTGVLGAQAQQQAKLIASDSGMTDALGVSTAIDGDTAIVGAYQHPFGAYSGAAYVFVRSGTTWTQQAKLVASDGATNDHFGVSVAIAGDTAIIGANGGGTAGASYVFVRSGTTWTQQAKLVASDAAADDNFGLSVALSGNTAIAGADGDDHAGGADAGAAYVFVRSGTTWTQQAKLITGDAAAGDSFGQSMQLSGDTAIVGAFRDDHAGGVDAGSAYIFVRSGTTWTEQAKLIASDAAGNDAFGANVAIDGDTAIVGSYLDDHVGGVNAGSAYVFVRSGTTWTEQSKLVASDAAANDSLGTVAIAGDIAIVGAYVDDHAGGIDAGAAYVFARTGTTWTEQAKLIASDAAASDNFGASVAIEGETAIVGAYRDDHAGLTDPGSAYVFSLGSPSEPRDVELVDVDGDGDLDIATANQASDDVGLRANDGSGTMGAETTVALTAADLAPVALTRGDLDNDGARDDLAVVCNSSSTLVLLTNPASVSPGLLSLGVAGLRPACIATGDLDGNPIDDVVIGREGEPFAGGAGLGVARNGGATVDLPIPAPHPTRVVKLALADLDGDGDLDLAAIAQGGTDEVLLFAGDGAGAFTFAGAFSLSTSGLANGLCCGDLDGNGTKDLAVVLPQLFPPAQSLRIYRRTSTGALAPGLFTAGADITTSGTFAVDLACGDLEDDSIDGFLARVDLAQANAGSGTATIRHGYTGTGFGSTTSPTVGTNPVAVAIGDLNNDGCDDVVVANQGSDDVTVLLTTPPALAQVYGTACGGPTISAVGMPTSGNPAFGVRVSNARATAPMLLMFSLAPADIALPPSTCRLLLSNPIAQLLLFTNGSGQATLTFGVPSGAALLGVDLYFQGAVFHSPGGAFADTLDISDALRTQVGQ